MIFLKICVIEWVGVDWGDIPVFSVPFCLVCAVGGGAAFLPCLRFPRFPNHADEYADSVQRLAGIAPEFAVKDGDSGQDEAKSSAQDLRGYTGDHGYRAECGIARHLPKRAASLSKRLFIDN